jgi:hypothetical protein
VSCPLLAAALGLALAVPAAAGCPDASPLEPPCGAAALERMRDAFVARAAAAGLTLPFTPALREREEAGLVAWSAERRELSVPHWPVLAPEERRLLVRMAGSEDRAPELFTWLHRWYLPARELARAFQAVRGAPPPGSRAERAAHDAAVAFLREEAYGPERVARLASMVEAAAARLADEDGPAARTAFAQLRLARDSLRRRDSLRFVEAAARLRGS